MQHFILKENDKLQISENNLFGKFIGYGKRESVVKLFFFFYPMPHMSLTDFVVFPPGLGRSVTDFSGWDAHEARLRCPDDASGDIGGCSARRPLKPNFY